ncbi:MAG: pyruvate, phosphate dikinase/phosphoenolpyruvate synthase regulator [Desulfotalea sp.]
MLRHVYYISSNTALLAKDMGKSLLSQFPETKFIEEAIPFIKTIDGAKNALEIILARKYDFPPIILSTIFKPEVNDVFDISDVIFMNICAPHICSLEILLEEKALRRSGTARNLNKNIFNDRVDAIHYTIAHDDGTAIKDYEEADLIIVGISRAGKTPVSVFLATQLGIKTANYPLVENDLQHCNLPEDIIRNKDKVVGLSISPTVLNSFREQRYQGSNYARIETCKKEVILARRIFDKYKFPVVFSDGRSIEETATQVSQELRKHWNPSF